MSTLRVKRNYTGGGTLPSQLLPGELAVFDNRIFFGPKSSSGETAVNHSELAVLGGNNNFTEINTFRINSNDDFQIKSSGDVKKTYANTDGWLYSTATVSDIDAANQNILVNRAYIEGKIQGLNIKDSVRLATTTALPSNTYNNGTNGVGATLTGTANGALTIDGITVSLLDRILVKNEVLEYKNGIYIVSNPGGVSEAYVLTRATDIDTSSEIVGAYTFVQVGTTNEDTGWSVSNWTTTNIVGTDNIIWVQFSSAGNFVADEVSLTKIGNEFSIKSTWIGQTSITTLGTIGTGTWQGGVISSTYGGTGVNNGGRTLTINDANKTLAGNATVLTFGGNFTTSGAHTTTFTTTGNTSVTLPTSGTLATTSQLHTRSHAMTSTSDHTAGNWMIFYSNGSGQVVELGLGASGQVLKSNGVDVAPSWQADNNTTYSEISTVNIQDLDGSNTGLISGRRFTDALSRTGVTGTETLNIFTGATSGSDIKTINIGGSGVSGSITDIYLGSSVSGANNAVTIGGASSTNSLTVYGNTSTHGNLSIRASATSSAATQIPVFIADPSSTTRVLVTRTPEQFRGDIGAGTPYTLPLAADGTRGGIQIGYVENGQNYPVELSSEKAFVNVPWVNTNTATAADNILDGSNSGTQITYAPYTTDESANANPRFYTHTSAPASSAVLKYNGILHVNSLEAYTDIFLPSGAGGSVFSSSDTVLSISVDQTQNAMTLNSSGVLTTTQVEALIDGGIWT